MPEPVAAAGAAGKARARVAAPSRDALTNCASVRKIKCANEGKISRSDLKNSAAICGRILTNSRKGRSNKFGKEFIRIRVAGSKSASAANNKSGKELMRLAWSKDSGKWKTSASAPRVKPMATRPALKNAGGGHLENKVLSIR